MSKLSEFLEWKEIHQRKSEQHAEAVKFYESKIIGEMNMDGKTIKGNTGLGTTTVTTHEDKLSVEQEACNNAWMAVQGIRQAHAEKNGEPRLDDNYFGITFEGFDKSVKRTWKDQGFIDAVSNASLGLSGEAGEVADLIKKAIYHGRGFSDIPNTGGIKKNDVKDELSDVLFYVSAMAQEFGFTLEEVALHNKAKLEKRYSKGFTVEESANKRDKGGKN